MKRLFAVFVIVTALLFMGCQKAEMISTTVSSSNTSIFFMSDKIIADAGIIKSSSTKDSTQSRDIHITESHVDSPDISDSSPDDIIIQPAYDTPMITDTPSTNNDITDTNYDDTKDEINSTDRHISYPEISAADDIPTVSAAGQNESDIPILTSPPETDSDASSLYTLISEDDLRPSLAPASVPDPSPVPTPEPTPTPEAELFIIDETQTLIGYIGTATDISIPEDVLNIGPEVFKDNSRICSVTIPCSVKEISSSAFKGCTSLTTVKFSGSSNLTRIASGAFEDCILLDSIDIPESVNVIDDSAFKNCPLGDTLIFYSDINIGSNAFENTSIQTISFQSDSEIDLTVSPYAFANCSNLSAMDLCNVKMPANLAENTFFGVNDLTVYVKNNSDLFICRKMYPPNANNLGLSGTLSFCKK